MGKCGIVQDVLIYQDLSQQELEDLVTVESSYICCMTGRRVCVHDKKRNRGVVPYWEAVVDHKKQVQPLLLPILVKDGANKSLKVRTNCW